MSNILPEFAYPTERFLVSGFGDDAFYLNPTIICKYYGKTFLAKESLLQFAQLITSATAEEEQVITDVLKDISPVACGNYDSLVAVDDIKGLKDCGAPLIVRYIEHLEAL